MDEYYFDEEAAQKPVDWIETYIPYPDGNYTGSLKLLDFQKELIREAFGWKRKKDHRRKHSIVYIEIPKGNGKSALVSALCLYMLIKEGEIASEIYCCAGSQKQARKVFAPCKVMVARSPEILGLVKPYDFSILDKETMGKIEVVSADGPTNEGHKPNFIAFDELHVQPNDKLWNAMRAGLTKKDQPMMFVMTTAGLTSTFAEGIHLYALGILNGVHIMPNWLVKIWAADVDDDPFDEEVWKRCNPGWEFINQEEFKNEANEARTNPAYLNNFKRLHLNRWTGSRDAFIPVEKWDLCNFGKIDLTRRRKCFLGIDNAVTRDICAAAILFPPDDPDGIFEIKLFGWCPSETIRDREANENVNYPEWVRLKWINSVPGTSVETAALYDVINPLMTQLDIVELQYDRRFMSDLVVLLTNDGMSCEPMQQDCARHHEPIEFMTNLVINKKNIAAEGEEENLIPDPKLNHEGNPVFRWMINNAVVYMDTGGLKRIDKKGSREKIDYVAASIMAFYGYLQSIKKTPEPVSALLSGLV